MNPRIGVLGAGQLGLMLCHAARRLGLEIVVAASDASEPAIAAADGAVVGPFEDPAVADRMIRDCDVVTFEFEAIPAPMLERLADAERRGAVAVRPGVEILRTIRNKASQKRWMRQHRIPTLPFQVLDGDPRQARDALAAIGLPAVQKAQVGGYDGRGVQVIRTQADVDRLWPVPSLLEPCLDDREELAVVAARGVDGSVRCYAPVQLHFDEEHNILHTALTPASLPAPVLDEALSVAQRAVAALEGVGVFAIELFVTPDARVLVNEISPRVHNAGHHTVESCAVSQFEQHLRAVAGLPLGSTEGERPALMRNLLYSDALAPLVGSPAGVLATATPETFVHWYGKVEARPFRKMGHVTALAADAQSAERLVEAALTELVGSIPGAAA